MRLNDDHTLGGDGFIASIVKGFAVCVVAVALKSVNRAPAVLLALVAIWTESITSSCTSFVSRLLIAHYVTVVVERRTI